MNLVRRRAQAAPNCPLFPLQTLKPPQSNPHDKPKPCSGECLTEQLSTVEDTPSFICLAKVKWERPCPFPRQAVPINILTTLLELKCTFKPIESLDPGRKAKIRLRRSLLASPQPIQVQVPALIRTDTDPCSLPNATRSPLPSV